jgi:hypothetical protein
MLWNASYLYKTELFNILLPILHDGTECPFAVDEYLICKISTLVQTAYILFHNGILIQQILILNERLHTYDSTPPAAVPSVQY